MTGLSTEPLDIGGPCPVLSARHLNIHDEVHFFCIMLAIKNWV